MQQDKVMLKKNIFLYNCKLMYKYVYVTFPILAVSWITFCSEDIDFETQPW